MPPLPVSLHGLTHIGRVRQRNEDSVLACTLGERTRVWVSSLETLPDGWEAVADGEEARNDPLVLAVADGVGGGPGGQEASRLTLALLPDVLREALEEPAGDEDIRSRLARAVRVIHRRLEEEGRNSPALAGMATTLTAWVGLGDAAHLIQVGDSRCYRMRGGRLSQLTHDQTMAQDMVDQGLVADLEEAPRISQNILTSALGGNQLTPRVDTFDRATGDVILVCSDGVMKHIPDAEIGTRLGDDVPPREMAEGLVRTAVEDGGLDNVSVIVAREG